MLFAYSVFKRLCQAGLRSLVDPPVRFMIVFMEEDYLDSIRKVLPRVGRLGWAGCPQETREE